ncbi:methylmalonyl-CoA epimerase [Agrobacterium fabrum]|uniref:methylmalonyl-CoA epimerase n=1 Tax=Agrobacterium fabrum TaxID=1176649 RepID=UPI0015747CE6|nr:methylmalonyl-CoA epimerase [Agrobacterium fabrum]WCK80167.1 methylmalonyl-CoA epimerase [Agrobacterium fabrum]
MIRRVNHIAIAVPDLELASETYRRLGVSVSEPQELPEHGVQVCFLEFENFKIELVQALGDGSPVERFMEKNRVGGIHHICFEVEALDPLTSALRDIDIRVLGSGGPKIGAHGNPVIFAHPSDLFGVLTEFEEVAGPKQW